MQILERGYDMLEMEFPILEPASGFDPDEASGPIPFVQTIPAASESIRKRIREITVLHNIPLSGSDILLIRISRTLRHRPGSLRSRARALSTI